MKYLSHLNTAVSIIGSYNGQIPLSSFLKQFFKGNKKYGSNDRKLISALCYNYFRLGQSVSEADVKERILLGTFLCEEKNNPVLAMFKPEWDMIIQRSVREKLGLLKDKFQVQDFFPFKDQLSDGMEEFAFSKSFLLQPHFFIRIRPGKKETVLAKLKDQQIEGELIDQTCMAFPNRTKIELAIELDKEAVVQDYNSQRAGEYMKVAISALSKAGKPGEAMKIWDCCAGSGGKSIMAFDINNNVQLTATDKRSTIIENLRHRFQRSGIKKYTASVLNLESKIEKNQPEYDMIIADVPCTGSGTWSRTPEQLYFFKKEAISKYSSLQKQIITNAIPFLKPGGWLVYVTCSVFREENEGIVKFIEEKIGLSFQKSELLKCYEIKADALFVALFRKPKE